MTTDKDREDIIEDLRAYNDGWMLKGLFILLTFL